MPQGRKRRVALVGTGPRGAGTWGKELLANCGEWVELVGLSDDNSMRRARARMGDKTGIAAVESVSRPPVNVRSLL